MKTKSIILPAIAGLVILTSAGTLTFAASNQQNSGVKHSIGGGFRGMKGGLEGIKNLSDTDRQIMMAAVQKAVDAKDYIAFKEAYTRYGITVKITEDQFKEILKKKAEMDQKRSEKEALKTKIQDALKNGDFETRKTLNKDKPILKYIDTQEKFTKLQEMESYREKIKTIAKDLGLPQGKGDGEGNNMRKGEGMGFGK